MLKVFILIECQTCFIVLAAPSAVPTVHLMGATASTMSLSWLPPEKPNGIILDYEIKYHEKVRSAKKQQHRNA